MRNRSSLKYMGLVMICLCCSTALVLWMHLIAIKKTTSTIRDVQVIVMGKHHFINQSLLKRLLTIGKKSLLGNGVQNAPIQDLERFLSKNPFVKQVKAFVTIDGVLHVKIQQREAIIRIINQLDQHFYIDEDLFKMPLSRNFTPRVLVANGAISEPFTKRDAVVKNSLTRDICKIAHYVRNDHFWNAQIEQIYVTPHKEFELIPRVGNHKILLGDAVSLSTKFRNLLAFYQQVLPHMGWETYKFINIKFTSQVIGVK